MTGNMNSHYRHKWLLLFQTGADHGVCWLRHQHIQCNELMERMLARTMNACFDTRCIPSMHASINMSLFSNGLLSIMTACCLIASDPNGPFSEPRMPPWVKCAGYHNLGFRSCAMLALPTEYLVRYNYSRDYMHSW